MSPSDSSPRSTLSGQTAIAVGAVLSLHAAALWAFNAGLLHRPADIKPPEALVAVLIAPPPPEIVPPKPEPVVAAPTPPEKTKPRPAPPKPKAAPRPAPAPRPLASRNAADTAMAVPAPEPATPPTPPAPPLPPPVPPAPPAPPAPPPAPKATPARQAGHASNPIEYPESARRMGEEGVVLVRVLVTADGRAGEVELKRGSGYDRLDQAALRAVRKWRFVPATKNGEPTDAWLDQPVNFKLNT